MSTTLVLADDHHVVRQALKTLLEAELDCTVIGEAADGVEAIAVVEQLKPDVLIVDLLMQRLNGMEVIRRLHKHMPNLRNIVLSMHAEESYVREALRAGASSYVLKESKASELVHAIREVLAGRRYLSPTLSDRMIDSYIQQSD